MKTYKNIESTPMKYFKALRYLAILWIIVGTISIMLSGLEHDYVTIGLNVVGIFLTYQFIVNVDKMKWKGIIYLYLRIALFMLPDCLALIIYLMDGNDVMGRGEMALITRPALSLIWFTLTILYFQKRKSLFCARNKDEEKGKNITVIKERTEDVDLIKETGDFLINSIGKYSDNIFLNDSDYGLVPEKPIMTRMPDESERYLSSINCENGSAITWERTGSMSVESLPGVFIDAYHITAEKIDTNFYICMYGMGNSTTAPKGFIYGKDNKEEILEVNDNKTIELKVNDEIKFCYKCGNSIGSEAIYCEKCGTKVR